MKTLIRYFLLLPVLFIASTAAAQSSFLIFSGIRGQSGSAPAPSDTSGNKTSFQIGLKGTLPVIDGFYVITGLGFTQRVIGLRSLDPAFAGANITATIYLNSLDVPVLAQYSINDQLAIFGGPILAFNLSSKCESDNPAVICSVSDIKPLTIPLTIGFAVGLSNSFGINVFYENTQPSSGLLSEFAKDLNNYRALGANITFSF